jgi:hypothetical protein
MKKMSKILSGVLSGLFLLSFAGVVLAQTQKPDQAPPKLDKLEDGAADPSLSVGKPEPKNKVTEKRNNAGKVTEVQVKSGKSNYTLKADPEVGNAPKGTVQGNANRAPQWTILEFGGKKKAKKSSSRLYCHQLQRRPYQPVLQVSKFSILFLRYHNGSFYLSHTRRPQFLDKTIPVGKSAGN